MMNTMISVPIPLLFLLCHTTGAITPKEVHMRHVLLFLYNKNNSIGERAAAAELKEVYGDDAMKKTACGEWLRKFSSGEKGIEDLEDRPRSGRPSTFNEARLKEVVEEDDTITTRELAAMFNSSTSTIFTHLHAIGKVSKSGHWIPHKLTEKNKADRKRIASELLERYDNEELNLDEILTMDEKWVMYENPIRRHHWVDKNASASGTPKAELHANKVMLSAFWDTEGIV